MGRRGLWCERYNNSECERDGGDCGVRDITTRSVSGKEGTVQVRDITTRSVSGTEGTVV